MTARMPRSHLRMTPGDLLPGEQGIVTQFDIVIDKDRRTYIKRDCLLHGVWGRNDERQSHYHGELLVQREDDDSYTLVVSKKFTGHFSEPSPNDYKELLSMDRIHLLGDKEIECDTCKGRGYHQA